MGTAPSGPSERTVLTVVWSATGWSGLSAGVVPDVIRRFLDGWPRRYITFVWVVPRLGGSPVLTRWRLWASPRLIPHLRMRRMRINGKQAAVVHHCE